MSNPTPTQRCRMRIDGMDCPDCAIKIERGLRAIPGVKAAHVDFMARRAEIEYETGTVAYEDLAATVARLGYTPVEWASVPKNGQPDASTPTHALILMWSSGVFNGCGWILTWLDASAWALYMAFGAAILTGGVPTMRKALAAVQQRSLDMYVLMSTAVIGAVIIGEWSEAAMVVFLFALANHLEAQSMDRARHAVRSLMALSPRTALVLRDGMEVTMPVEQLRVGDTLIVKPGTQIPIDGRVIEGYSSVNQAPITGESVPVEKSPGDDVFAGAVNGEGALIIEATTPPGETTFDRILRLVETAQTRRAPAQRFVDRFARIYTPVVIALAVIVAALPPLLWQAALTEWVYRALVLLVIACPCALVISTPVAIVSALTTAARNGVLIKGGLYLEQLGALKTVAFDKTGTLSYGRPVVTDVIPLNGVEETTFLQVVTAIESRSEHPIARAVSAYARSRHITPAPVEQFAAMPGAGAQALVQAQKYVVGNHRLFETLNLLTPAIEQRIDDLQRQGKTVVLAGSETAIIGLIAVTDQAREDAAEAVARLRGLGLGPLTMLTGDHADTAQRLADRIGLDAFQAGLLPDEKVSAVQGFIDRHGKTAMVGDGINDAPALATATVGIAMGHAGTDTALETADVALMRDDLRLLPYAVTLSRRTRTIIRQNLTAAILIKFGFLLSAILGIATLWMAVAADMGASLLVVFNSLRLLKLAFGW